MAFPIYRRLIYSQAQCHSQAQALPIAKHGSIGARWRTLAFYTRAQPTLVAPHVRGES